jgi:hypothetical protein
MLSALLTGAPASDTTTYADRATRELVARAMLRHQAQDSTVRDYQAKLRYRVSFAFGKRKWATAPSVAVEELDARVAWQLPNDLRLDILGRRSATKVEGADITSMFSRPWFVPRTLGDSIRLLGESGGARAAPHPLAPGADQLYRYTAGDSVTIASAGHRVTIRSVTVTPKGKGASYVAGKLWIDVATGDLARFTFRLVGTEIWSVPDSPTHDDSASAKRANAIVSRILQIDADLEYALQDNKYWMPYRQVLAGKVSIPLGVNIVVPFEAITSFDDYSINTGSRVTFTARFPDSTAPRRPGRGRVAVGSGDRRPPAGPPPVAGADTTVRRDSTGRPLLPRRGRDRAGYLPNGGRFQIHRAPADSLKAYSDWGDSLVFDDNPADRQRIRDATADLARMAETLDGEMTGRSYKGISWEKFGEVLRYNRVEGTTLSLSGQMRAPVSFTDLFGTVRVGLADERLLARVAAVRDAPGGRMTLAVQRDLVDIDPFARGLNFGNSLRGIFAGHDDGAYLLAQGARFDFENSWGLGTEFSLGARAEDHRSVGNSARAAIPRLFGADGYFPPNEPVREGLALGGQARLDHTGSAFRWSLQGDGLAIAGRGAARLAGELRLTRLAGGWLTAQIKGGLAAGVDSVPQLLLRAGGSNTVRGYDFGVAHGDALWSAQLDLSRPGKGALKPVFFLDAGQAGNRANFGEALFLSGAGAGFSLLGGFMRAELSYPLTHRDGRGVRFDLVFGGLR